jgi:phosphate transport system substrate-binding protein
VSERNVKRLVPLVVLAAVGVAACSSSSTPKASSSSTVGSAPGSTSSSATATASPATGNPASAVTLNEDGSTLIYPYLQELVAPLHNAFSNITLNPGPGGSGKGISDAIAGTMQMGGSDAYLSSSLLAANAGLMNIPIVISAQAVNYNLAGVSNLKLSGDVLAKMYEGKITKWNDPAIAALNPGVSLPATTVVPVRRVDASGDTFIFTSLLSDTNSEWKNGPAFGTSVTWPAAPGELTASGNPGMVQTCHATPGCVAYIGVSVEASAQSAGLGEAMLEDQAGNFVLPTQANIESAVSAGSSNVPDNLAAPLIYEPGAQSYPIVNFEYIIVKSQQSSADVAQAIRTFLTWVIDPSGGSTSAYLAKEDFVALPSAVVPKVKSAVAKISG